MNQHRMHTTCTRNEPTENKTRKTLKPNAKDGRPEPNTQHAWPDRRNFTTETYLLSLRHLDPWKGAASSAPQQWKLSNNFNWGDSLTT